VPGETYALQVIVTDPQAMRWGFELSAIGGGGDQAGQLIPASDGRTFVQTGSVNGKTVQFIEHTSVGSAIGSSNVFQFSYRTPDDPNFGSIRFNLAGNAANGNGNNQGDYIYAIEVNVPSVAASSERQFVMAPRGGSSVATMSGSTPLNVGFARIVNSSGTAGPGLAFIGYRQGNVLVSESGVAASAAIRSGRIFAEIGGTVKTGLALVNSNSQPAAVSFFFTDDGGGNLARSNITVAANSQIAGFLDQAPFFSPNAFSGPISNARAFTFTSDIPVSAMAVRTRSNERGDFMMTTLPVADLSVSSGSSISIPHVADGGGWTTEVLLVNSTDAPEAGTFQFISNSGQSMSVNINGQTSNQFTYSVPARSSRRFRTAGTSSPTATGWIEISPSTGNGAPSVAAVLSGKTNNVTVSETAIAGTSNTNAARVYAELSGNFGSREALSVRTGVAISNRAMTSVNVNIEATNLDGTVVGTTTLLVPARGQAGLLLGDLPELKLSAPFTGILWVSAPAGSSVSVSGLRARYNERQAPDLLITAFPAFDAAGTAGSGLVFPQVVDSGGYSTRFVLMGASASQSAGSLQFISQNGQPLPLALR